MAGLNSSPMMGSSVRQGHCVLLLSTQQFRRVAMGYDKLARNFFSAVRLVAVSCFGYS
jgi:hypothetical protein